jgi:asparagine synthase (glutamine-hydrolysing)
VLPGADSGTLESERFLHSKLGRMYPVVLSGIGGDELLGGVPSAMPELADLLVSGQLQKLAARSLQWCLVDRCPLVAMLAKATRFTARCYGHSGMNLEPVPSWIAYKARRLCAFSGSPQVEQDPRIGLRPSTIEAGLTWWFLLEALPHLSPSLLTKHEYRYPYLDRELVEFLFRVPREKLLNPGQRRTLMRNALKDVVPTEILERRRKAFVVRKPLLSLQASSEKILSLFEKPVLAEYGLISVAMVRTAVHSVAEGREPQLWTSLMRCISLELWLRAASLRSPESGIDL